MTQYNIVPGLMGVVLTMTMVMITALAVTRERERGTMESLLATPALPLEVMTGKIIPYILVGYVQVSLILLAAKLLFHVPMVGSFGLLYLSALCFIAATLAVGITISTLATNQLQALQMSFFFFLPSLLLSGFMFPFRGMPEWAQAIGQVLPTRLRVLRGILPKRIPTYNEIGVLVVSCNDPRYRKVPTGGAIAPVKIAFERWILGKFARQPGPMPMTEEHLGFRILAGTEGSKGFLRLETRDLVGTLSLMRFLRSRLWKLLAKRCASSQYLTATAATCRKGRRPVGRSSVPFT